MQEGQEKAKIVIPEGRFEGHCYGCHHSKRDTIQADGSVFCKRAEGYVLPEDNRKCKGYIGKVMYWIVIAIAVYILVTVLAVIFHI
jgi:hypothetical protein